MRNWTTVLSIIFLACAAGASIYVAQTHITEPAPKETSATTKPEKTKEPVKLSLEKKFQVILNGFLQNVARKIMEYKNQRQILNELVKPESLRNPEYAEENYQLSHILVPELHQKIGEILGAFDESEAKIKNTLADEPRETQAQILKKWQELKEKQGQGYAEFFIIEQKLLDLYLELISFYRSRAGAYNIDLANNEIIFQNPKDQAYSEEILSKIEALEQEKTETLKAR